MLRRFCRVSAAVLVSVLGVASYALARNQPAVMGFPSSSSGASCFDHQGGSTPGLTNICSSTMGWDMPVVWDSVPPNAPHTIKVYYQRNSGGAFSCIYNEFKPDGTSRGSVNFSSASGTGYQTITASPSFVNAGDQAFVECQLSSGGSVRILGVSYN